MIDRYIESTIGFERMDIAVTAAAIKGAYSGLDEQDGGVEDEKYLSWAAAQPPWLDLTGGGVRLHPPGPIALQLLQRGGGDSHAPGGQGGADGKARGIVTQITP